MSILDSLMKVNPPDELFHYTTQKGLLGIIQNKSIWTTKVLCLNDSSEYVLALRIAKEILTEFEKGGQYSLRKIELLRDDIDSIWKLNIFVSSFTEDSDLLSQWRAYSNSSGGYSIGFQGSKLIENATKQGFFLSKCVYDHEIQREIVTSLIKEYMSKDFDSPYGLADSQENPRTISIFSGTEFWKDLGALAPILKDDGFKEEKEWRIISESAMSSSDVSYRTGKSYIIPFFGFILDKPNDLFSSITIGPTPHPDISENSLRMLLQKHGLSQTISINHTNIPYRNW